MTPRRTAAAVLSLCAVAVRSLNVEQRGLPATDPALQSWFPAPPGAQGPGPLAEWLSDRHVSDADAAYPRTDTVNLDLPPRERWADIVKKFRDETIPYMTYWDGVLSHHTEIDRAAWAEGVRRKTRKDHLEELGGIVAALDHPHASMENLLVFAAMYEVGSPMACSEVLAAGPDGSVIHGRNLDYRVISPVVEVTYTRGGSPLFVATIYIGMVGLHTAMKPGHWSFGQNTRVVSPDSAHTALAHLQADGVVYTHYVREIMEEPLSYKEAVRKLQEVPLLKDMYFIVGGSGRYEGAVIDRAADPSYRHTHELSQADPQRWFLFQTNDDMDGPPRDLRRDAGVKMMSQLSQADVSPERLRKLMMTPPVYVGSNVVLFMMAPKSGQYCSILGPTVTNDDKSVDEQRCALADWRHHVE